LSGTYFHGPHEILVSAFYCIIGLSHHCVVIYNLSFRIIDDMSFGLEQADGSAHVLDGVSGVSVLITTDEQLQENRDCYFSTC